MSRFERWSGIGLLAGLLGTAACETTLTGPQATDSASEAMSIVGSTLFAGFGTATIDGVLHAAEWATAGTVPINVNVPEGGTTPGELYVMNDATNLYFAVRFDRGFIDPGGNNVIVLFDNDADGVRGQPGDDFINYWYDFYHPSLSRFRDLHFYLGNSGIFSTEDVAGGGTTDGAGAFARTAGSNVFELAHPLNSLDDAHDISLFPGQDVGLQFLVQLGVTNTYFPNVIDVVRLRTAPVQSPIQAKIDIRPDDPTNTIDCANPDFPIFTVLFGSEWLNTADVDHATLKLAGAEEVHRRDDGSPVRHVMDYNRDRKPDLAIHVRFGDTSLTCSSTEAVLVGRTLTGQPIEGSASVRTIGGPAVVRILVDASRDGGVWWFPQVAPFNPALPHQGKALADYLRGRGHVVDELGRGETITSGLLAGYDVVLRMGIFGPAYSTQELQAYDEFADRGRAIVLAVGSSGGVDALAARMGVTWIGPAVSGTVANLAAHPVTRNVASYAYLLGMSCAALPPGAIIGWLPGNVAVMGVTSYRGMRAFFTGDIRALELVQQPFTENLLNWLLTGT